MEFKTELKWVNRPNTYFSKIRKRKTPENKKAQEKSSSHQLFEKGTYCFDLRRSNYAHSLNQV